MNAIESTLYPIFETLSDGICITDSGGRLIYVNPAAQRLLGAEEQSLTGASLCDLLCARLQTPSCSNCATDCALRKPEKKERGVTFNGRYNASVSFDWQDYKVERHEVKRQLRVRCLKATTPWLDSWEPEKHFTIIEDASAEAQLELERENWRNMIVHDIRTPLTAVFGVIRMVQESLSSKEPLDANMLRLGVKSCGDMMSLLDQYLDLAKLDAKAAPIHLAAVPLKELAREAVQELQAAARERGVIFEDKTASLNVSADPALLKRVLLNFLSNAVKFSPAQGRVTLSSTALPSGSIRVVVSDEGPGVALEDRDRLFDRFYQANVRLEGKTKGTGLGLAFCREAAKAMGAQVGLLSKGGKGAAFYIDLAEDPSR